jgi:hypothetical protein
LDYNRSQARGPREPIAIFGFYPPIVAEELFTKVQQKLKNESDPFQNAYAHRTQYLLSRLVVCDVCGHNYLGTSAKSGQYHYYCSRTYLQKGRQACNAPLINKEKLEKAVLDQIQAQILTKRMCANTSI